MSDTPEDLLARLAEAPNHPYPEAIILAMIRRREEMKPALLAVVEDAGARPSYYLEGGRWKALIFAAYLLAQFRETRAFKPLCATLNLPSEVTDALWGDVLTEDMGRMLASVYDGDDAPLRAILANPGAYEFAQSASVPKAYLCLLEAGVVTRDHVQSVAADVLTNLLPREPHFGWDGWTGLCADLGFADLLPLIERAIDEDLLDPMYYGFDELIRRAKSGGTNIRREKVALIEDTIKETSWWHSWSKPVKPKPLPPAPVMVQPRTGPKVGRNDPCPCGSGKKHKKCCVAAA